MIPTFSLRKPAVIINMLLLALLVSSCSSINNRSYFTDLPDTYEVNLPPLPQEERVVEIGDYLNIVFNARDKEAAAFFNRPVSATGGNNGESGFLVDQNGYIEFPIIGRIKAAGVTARELKENLTKSAGVYLKEPLVDVNFTTFRISIIAPYGGGRGGGSGGGSGSGGVQTLPMQQNTLLQAIAMAGGGSLALNGRISEVRLFRDYKGQRTVYKFDLTKKAVLNNPDVFQLRHNDVLYIKPRRSVIAREDLGLFTTVFSVVVSLISFGFLITNR
jgi:polysaccharide biosynthesis/export protein